MVNALTTLIEDTPFIQLFLLYALFYYKDLGRFLHPRVRKERKALSDWYDVLTNLKLISSSSSLSSDLRENSTKKKIYLLFLAPALLSCLADLLFFFVEISWFESAILQTVSAFMLITTFSYYYLGETASHFSMLSTKLEEGKVGSRNRHLSGK